jgi:enamine deaminase RidA (YjgF/YER057c/UK114 family)
MENWHLRGAFVVATAVLLTLPAAGQKRRDKDQQHIHLAPVLEIEKEKKRKTQQLSTFSEPPIVQTGQTAQLTFRASPLIADGILSKQVRSALKALFRQTRKNRIVHLRAFVAGSGDTRRVQAVVSEMFAERNSPLPSLSVVQVGKLAMPMAQVMIEAVAESKKAQNAHGLAFISGQAVASGEAVLEVAPLAKRSIDNIRSATFSLGSEPGSDVLRVTCFCSSLDDSNEVRREMKSAFPGAVLNHMQLRRVYTRASVNCEAVVRLREDKTDALKFENPERLVRPTEHSQVAIVTSERLAFSGTQIAFAHQDEDVKLAFERLEESLDDSGSAMNKVVFSRFYTLSSTIGDSIRRIRFGFFDRETPPASTMVELEGLPSLDASFAMDVIAVTEQ